MNLLNIKPRLKKERRMILLILLTIVTYVLFVFISPGFGSVRTFANILYANASLLICSIGMTFIVLIGGIDLSIAATNAFSGIIAAKVMIAVAGGNVENIGIGILGLVIAIVVSAVIGIVNGSVSTYFNISPFIVTLATLYLVRGLAVGLTNSLRVPLENKLFSYLGQGELLDTGIPVVLLLIVLLYVVSEFLLDRTIFGRRIMAIGGNKDAATASGINSNRLSVLVYAFAGVFVGLAAVITVGRSNAAHPLAAINAEMEIIAIVVLSGTNLSGGQGNMRNTFVSGILLAVINTGLQMLTVSPYMQYVIKGIIILIAIFFDQIDNYKMLGSNKALTRDKEISNISLVNEKIQKSEQKMISLNNISKSFPGVKALDDVSLEVKCGTVHAVLGENGAGKSTLIKVLSGVYKKDSGSVCVDDIPVEIKAPMIAHNLGISVIYQEFSLIPELPIFQNVFLGKEENRGKLRVILDKKKMKERTKEILKSFGLNLNVMARTYDHAVGQLQAIEIAKALSANAWVIVMDEPTSALSEADKDKLFEIIRELKKQNVAIIYISHRLSEIFEIADEVTVLRDGKTVYNASIKGLSEQVLIKHMVGRELDNIFYREKSRGTETILEVKDLCRKGVFGPISFQVKAGEVLGFSGLMGAGRTEIMRCIYGLDKPDSGEIYLDGEKIRVKSPADAIANGIGMVSEDRRREGIIPYLGVGSNISLTVLKDLSRYGIINKKNRKGDYREIR